MNRLKIILFLFVSLAAVNSQMFAQGEAALQFLQIAPDSRFSALGESGAGLADNSSAVFWNPAGAAFLTGQEICFTHSNWLPQFKLDLFYDYATYRNYVESLGGNLLASITFMNYGEFVRTGEDSPTPLGTFRSYDFAMSVGYAFKPVNDWGLGLNFRVIHSRLSSKGTGEEQGSGISTTVSFDIAAMWRPSSEFSVGANLSNMGPKIFYIDRDQADPIPTNLRLGFAYVVFADEYNSLTTTLDFSKLMVRRYSDGSTDQPYKALFTAWHTLKDVLISGGAEYWYGVPNDFLFSARAGIFYEDPNYGNRKFVTFGAGIRYDIYGFDFSYITTALFKGMENHPLADTLRFSILVGWDAIPEHTRGLPRGI